MAGSTRIKGSALALSFGGTDFWADVTSVKLTNDDLDGGALTFADAAGVAGRQYKLTGSAIQSLQTTSFWRYAWAQTGNVVAFRFAPFGNAVASADQPHFVGTVRVGNRPEVGGDAGANNDYTFDFEWDVQGVPTLDNGTDGIAVISTIGPAGKSAGQQVILSGTRFSGTTDVKFGATSVTSLIAASDTTIAVVIPTGSGVKAVTVIGPNGTSAPVNYTVS